MYRLTTFMITSVVLMVCCRFFAPAMTWLPLACLLGATAVLLARVTTSDVALTNIVAASFIVRCLLTVTLFAISAWHLPILQSLHPGAGLWDQGGVGIWDFGGDGVGYHAHAV